MQKRYILLIVAALFSIVVAALTAYTTDNGTVTIIKRFNAVVGQNTPGGPYFKIPLVDTTVEMSTLTVDNGVVVAGVTSDQQTLDVVVAVQWSISPTSIKEFESEDDVLAYIGDASKILTTYGSREAFDKNILDRRITKVTTDYISKQKLEDIVKKRESFTKDIEVELLRILSEYPIIIDGIQVVSITPSAKYMSAIEDKQIAEVNAQKAVEEAKGINTLAEANKNRVQKEAEATAYGKLVVYQSEATGITAKADALKLAGPNYLQLEYLNRWDGKRSLVVTGNDSGVDFGVGTSIGNAVVADRVR